MNKELIEYLSCLQSAVERIASSVGHPDAHYEVLRDVDKALDKLKATALSEDDGAGQ